jgi:hypothetical protein
MGMVTTPVEQKPHTRLRVAGTVLLLLAALLFVGSFVATSKTDPGIDLRSCRSSIPQPCDPSEGHNRQNVFFLWMGATLIVFVGGVTLRSVANRAS